MQEKISWNVRNSPILFRIIFNVHQLILKIHDKYFIFKNILKVKLKFKWL